MADVRPIDANALNLNDIPCYYGCNCDLEDVEEWVFNAPTLDYEPVRHGEWVEQEDFCGDAYYTCSACKIDWVCIDGTPAENGMRYCPNCGAKMDGGHGR